MKWLIFILFLCSLVYPLDGIQDVLEYEEVSSEADLGQKLFFDPILSLDRTISCASCHKPEFAFADTVAFSKGIDNRLATRNTPSVMNMALREHFFYDGRAKSLEEQAIHPIENPLEMNLPYNQAVSRVSQDSLYNILFKKIYSSSPDSINIAKALAAFQRSLESNGSAPHDRYQDDWRSKPMTESQRRGRRLFLSDEFKCFDCHFGPDFTGDEFRNIGLFDGKTLVDQGRYEVTKDSIDLGKFKVPGLRNVGLTAPYMHNGMFQTLEEVIDFYSNPYDVVKEPINIDSLMLEPLNFTVQQKDDLVNFLHALTDDSFDFEEE